MNQGDSRSVGIDDRHAPDQCSRSSKNIGGRFGFSPAVPFVVCRQPSASRADRCAAGRVARELMHLLRSSHWIQYMLPRRRGRPDTHSRGGAAA